MKTTDPFYCYQAARDEAARYIRAVRHVRAIARNNGRGWSFCRTTARREEIASLRYWLRGYMARHGWTH